MDSLFRFIETYWDEIQEITFIFKVVYFAVVAVGVRWILVLIDWVNEYKYRLLRIDKETKQSMKYYVPTRAQNTVPVAEEMNRGGENGQDKKKALYEKNLVSFFIKQEFKNKDIQYYIILADSGMGKTTFLIKLFKRYYFKLRIRKIAIASLNSTKTLDRIENIKHPEKTILLLDAMDEDREAVKNFQNRLTQVCDATEQFYKVVITCRTQFFPNDLPLYVEEGGLRTRHDEIEFRILYISFFSDQEIHKYLNRKYKKRKERKKRERAEKIVKNCPYLIVRPMLLAYIDELLVDVEKKYESIYEIYHELVNKWIEREYRDEQRRKHLRDFSTELALQKFEADTDDIDIKEVNDLCRKYGISIDSRRAAKARSLLNYNADGAYKFAHRSIMEFLLAEKAFRDENFRKKVVLEGFKGYDMFQTFLSEMSAAYFRGMLKKEKVLKYGEFFYYQLHNIDFSNAVIKNCIFYECSFYECNIKNARFSNMNLQNENMQDAGVCGNRLENCSFFQCDMRNTEFKQIVLKNVNIQDTDLSGCQLVGIGLKNSHLVGNIFRRADINHADLEGTNLSGSDLREANLEWTILRRTVLEGVNFAGADLKCADLSESLLRGSDFVLADLSGVDLSNVDIKGADFIGAYLKETVLSDEQRYGLGKM